MKPVSLSVTQRVGAAFCSVLLAVTMCLCPYAQAYAAIQAAAVPLGYALCAVLAACGVNIAVNSDYEASSLASSFELYTDDLQRLGGTVQGLMSTFADAAKASGQGVEYQPAAITAADVAELKSILAKAGKSGSLALDQIAPYASAAALSPLPFILQGFADAVVTPAETGFTMPNGFTVAKAGGMDVCRSAFVRFPDGSDYFYQVCSPASSFASMFGNNVFELSVEQLANMSISVEEGALCVPFYCFVSPTRTSTEYLLVPLSVAQRFTNSLELMRNVTVSLDGVTSLGMPVNVCAYLDDVKLGIVSANGIGGKSFSQYAGVSYNLAFSNLKNTYPIFSPYLNYSLVLGMLGFTGWTSSLTDNPDYNLGREYWNDANAAVKGGIVVGSGVGGLFGSGSVVSGGQVFNRGRLGIPGSWSGVDSWADALSRTGTAVGSDVWARNPAASTTVTGAAVDAATGAATGTLTGALDTVTRPGNTGGNISIAAPSNGLNFDFGGSAADLTDKFPFCIPGDVHKAVNALAASPQAPRFTWPVWSPAGFVDLEIDLSDYSQVASALRGMFSLLIIIGTAFLGMRFIEFIRNSTK